jgi:hypothetical protein
VPDVYDDHPYGGDEKFVKNYLFTYDWSDKNNGKEINISVKVPLDLYNYYVNYKTHLFANDFSNIPTFVTADDPVVKDIANQIYQLYKSTGMNPVVMAQLLVDEIVYTDDINSGYDEYPKYPVETLVDGKGDCEDTSFLLSSLLKFSGTSIPFHTVIIEFSNHLGIAILVPNDVYEYYIQYGMTDHIWENPYLNNGKFIYVETTGKKWKVGDMPTDLIGEDYTIHTIK